MRGSRVAAAAAVVVAALASAGTARAQFRGWGGAGSLSYDARYTRYTDGEGDGAGIPDLTEAVDLGTTLRALAGKSPFGFAVGFDTHLGGGLSGGFAYDVALSPFGVGVRAGKYAQLGVIAGVGVGGITDRVPFGVQFPVEVFADFWLSKYFRVHAWGTRRFITVADVRPHELSAGAALRFNRGYEQWGFASGNGYYVGVTYDERMDTEAIGVAIGYSIHFSTGRR